MTEKSEERIYREAKKRINMRKNGIHPSDYFEGWVVDYIDSSTTDEISVEKLQEIRIKELKDFNSTTLQVKLENQKLQKQLDSCIQTLIEASAAANITQDIVVGNLVDRKLADLAKTHENVTKYIEKVTGKNIDVVLAENASFEAEEENE